MASSSTTTISDNLLGSIQKFQTHDITSAHATHPFAARTEDLCARLQNLVHATDRLADSLTQYARMPVQNPKLVSTLRECSQITKTLQESSQNVHHVVETLRERTKSNYDEEIPLDPTLLVEWCVSRVETWGSSVGMECFRDNETPGKISLVLGGKVLVIDVDFAIDESTPNRPTINVQSVKTSYAISESMRPNSGGEAAMTLDAFLFEAFERFITEVQKPEDTRAYGEASRLGKAVLGHLRYLFMLDRLAARQEDGGLKWFGDVDELYPVLMNFAKTEAIATSTALGVDHAPLDIFLVRAHGLPLSYLTAPSVSFLVHISPLSYLSLLQKDKGSGSKKPEKEDAFPNLDISSSTLRSYLLSRPAGVATATLSLIPSSAAHLFSVSMSMSTFSSRPTFTLAPKGTDIDHTFPQITNLVASMIPANEPDGGTYFWQLDFTEDGKKPGIVMSQSRMRDIELIVNPLGGYDSLDMMSLGKHSWVDLLIAPDATRPAERYTTLYESPSSAHPPLSLRLTAPMEPGYRLERVPVHSMKEVWGILEVVREQCWLNEIIVGQKWTAEGLQTAGGTPMVEDSEATEEELQAVLSGNITPSKIPVNVFLPSQSIDTDLLFQTPGSELDPMPIHPRRPKIVMTSPERPPMSGLVEISVAYDESKPRGVAVEISGAMGAELAPEKLAEIARRGGTLGLPGRVWAKANRSG